MSKIGNIVFLTFVVLLVPLGISQANDSSAVLKGGGLVLLKSDKIKMVSETLIIRPDQISVGYQFSNITALPVSMRIAFPLPEISFEDAYLNHPSFPNETSSNFVGFETLVDGQPVEMESEHRFWVGKMDVTKDYLEHGFPTSMADPTFFTKADASQKFIEKMRALESPGLVQKTIFHWRQEFPPEKKLSISHRYKPVAGKSIIYAQDMHKLLQGRWRMNYCADGILTAEILKTVHENKLNFIQEVDYVLTTGGNWKGTIESFRLRVEGQNMLPYALFCLPDGKKGFFGKTFDLSHSDFVPRNELKVLFLGSYK